MKMEEDNEHFDEEETIDKKKNKKKVNGSVKSQINDKNESDESSLRSDKRRKKSARGKATKSKVTRRGRRKREDTEPDEEEEEKEEETDKVEKDENSNSSENEETQKSKNEEELDENDSKHSSEPSEQGDQEEEQSDNDEKEKRKREKYKNVKHHNDERKSNSNGDKSSDSESEQDERRRSRKREEKSESYKKDYHKKRRRKSNSSNDSDSSDDDEKRSHKSRSLKKRRHERRERRRHRDRSRNRSRDRSRDRSRGRSRDRYRDRDRERRRERERERMRREREREIEREKRREERRKKEELEEAKRDDLTVLVLNLDLKADERDIYEFFSEVAGKVRDIQCIKDQRSGKSKGVAYVEFYTQESVIKALAANGYMLKNRPIKVQSSQAEKNRAAKASKHHPIDPNDIPLKLYIGGLLGPLSNITEQELKQLFNPFGDILEVEIHRDPYTGKSKGFGFIQFHKASEAIEAMTVMNGMEVAGREIKVSYAQDSKYLLASDALKDLNIPNLNQIKAAAQGGRKTGNQEDEQDNEKIDNDDDDGGGLITGASSKIALMQKLQRDTIIDASMPSGYATGANAIARNSLASVSNPLNNVTPNIVLCNMFSPNDSNIGSDPDFFSDILEDVKGECSKYGNIIKIWLDTKNIDGKIYIKYTKNDESLKAFQCLNGRYFGGSLINAYFITNAIWESTCC
ncbi:splicing factor 1, putative [Plasmodium chabaudi chabaudi]|uniref:Splicing factor 1, putative n=1 Tax=Plasmodium chabaudi chabaudi TaxID=31271 RepID=A0A4V6M9Q1_PLACU|nr:splicing factor 1, putative [Plasmodium chabaudi chabaudi]VTZ70369.1 splicing factor 1, putative [Plasmodium chabaudi chabaudi]|eukprot:XP_016654636.1 splicing factor, putative [Plasmodium chabaudi chabaudi]